MFEVAGIHYMVFCFVVRMLFGSGDADTDTRGNRIG